MLEERKSNKQAGFFKVAEGNRGDGERFSSTVSRHQKIHLLRQVIRHHRPKDLSIFEHANNLIVINYCEDTRPQDQLSAVQGQETDLCLEKNPLLLSTPSLQNPNTHTDSLEALRIWVVVVISTKFVSKLQVHSALLNFSTLPNVPFSVLLQLLSYATKEPLQ